MLGVIAVQRAVELRIAARNERWAREQGAREHGRSHYPAFFVLHGAWLIAWPVEAFTRADGPVLAELWWAWAAAFGLAQILRYWAIRSLGMRWNTRILVFEDRPPIRGGAYRFFSHPNYVAVAIELVSVPMMFAAVWTAGIVSLLNAALLLGVRIPAEERALRGSVESRTDD
jgi:methyltransferase